MHPYDKWFKDTKLTDTVYHILKPLSCIKLELMIWKRLHHSKVHFRNSRSAVFLLRLA